MEAIYVITLGEIAFCPFFASIEFMARFSLNDIYGTTTQLAPVIYYVLSKTRLGRFGDWCKLFRVSCSEFFALIGSGWLREGKI